MQAEKASDSSRSTANDNDAAVEQTIASSRQDQLHARCFKNCFNKKCK